MASDFARAFYAGVLGMTEVDEPSARGSAPGAWSCTSASRAGSARPARPTPGILVADLEDVVRRLAAAGQQVTWDADLPGFRRVYAHDCFGNRLEFLQPA